MLGPSMRYYFGGGRRSIWETSTRMSAAESCCARSLLTTEILLTNEETQSGSAIQLLGGVAFYLSNTCALTPELSVNLESMEGESGTTIMLGVGLAGFMH
ncbi:MAG: hypothetical protein IPP40_08790 [bacterium]|nr:hypothetical protein [bacterium]